MHQFLELVGVINTVTGTVLVILFLKLLAHELSKRNERTKTDLYCLSLWPVFYLC